MATTYSVLDSQGCAGPVQTAAETTIKLDGDNTTQFPIQSTEGNFTLVNTLVELHLKNAIMASS